MSTIAQQREATIEDLYKIEGKAEIVNGRIVRMPLDKLFPPSEAD